MTTPGARPGAVLHHTMPYEMDAAKMLEVLWISQEKVSGKAVQSVEKRGGPLRHRRSYHARRS